MKDPLNIHRFAGKKQARVIVEKTRREARDVAMMSNPDDWPRWPVLPVKRQSARGWPECGLMLTGLFKVYKIGLFELVDDPFTDVPAYEYLDAAAIVADGWTVD